MVEYIRRVGIPVFQSICVIIYQGTYKYNMDCLLQEWDMPEYIRKFEGNRFSCDCRLDWMYVLHDKTAQPHIRNSLEELQCSMNIDKTTVTTEVVENLICSPSLFSNSVEETFDQDDYLDKENEADSGKVYLMSIPVRNLPCPPEYRPTPITVKQGSPPGVEVADSGSRRKNPYYLAVFLFIFVL